MYLTGTLDDRDSAQVEEMIRIHPEIRKETDIIRKTLYLTETLNIKSPSKDVKSSLLKIINTSNTGSKNKYSQMNLPGAENKYRFMLAAVAAFFVLSLGINYYLWKNMKEYEYRISVLNDRIKLMNQDYESVKNNLMRTSDDMKITMDRNYKMIDLKGLEKSPGSCVLTFWNPESKKVYVKIENLPIPPKDRQYQLWALINGKPYDLGMMDVDPADHYLHEMKDTENAQAFAITLEPKGGSINPTMSEMYALGEI